MNKMETKTKAETLQWKVHVCDLLQEILNNPECYALKIPLKVLANILTQVAQRATELNDKELNKLMMRLSLYAVSDPHDLEYNPELVSKYLTS